jgi:hypothetical protein
MNHEWHACSQADPLDCISYAAHKYGQPVALADQVAWCESRDEWWASNGSDFGLWQFAPGTFAETPYGRYSYWSARWSSLAAMWWWSQGSAGTSQWQCYP